MEQIHGERKQRKSCGSREREGEGRAMVPVHPVSVPVTFVYILFFAFECHGVYSSNKISLFCTRLGFYFLKLVIPA